MEMEAKVMTVTPEMAKEWLSNNKTNRRINPARVNSYARQIKSGKWLKNGEPIGIHEDGSLANGQHRLSAIVKTNIPMEMVVVFGIPNDVKLFDRGRNRSVSDIISINNPDLKISNRDVGIANMHYLLHGNNQASEFEIEEFINNHAETLIQIKQTRYSCKKGSVPVRHASIQLAFLYALETGEPFGKINRFTEVLLTGFYSSQSETAAIVLRNDLLTNKLLSVGGSTERKQLYRAADRALYDFCNEIQRTKTYSATTDTKYLNKFDGKMKEGDL